MVKCGDGVVEKDVEEIGLIEGVVRLEERGDGDSVAGADSREKRDGGERWFERVGDWVVVE